MLKYGLGDGQLVGDTSHADIVQDGYLSLIIEYL
jgi:hypothetical protein